MRKLPTPQHKGQIVDVAQRVKKIAVRVRVPRVFVMCAALGVGVVTLNILLRLAGLQWSLTGSMPPGVYQVTHDPLTRGQIVAVCLPPPIAQFGWQRGYLSRLPALRLISACPGGYQALLKRIAAVEGDVVEVRPEAVLINGGRIARSATQEVDRRGRALPHVPWGTYTLTRGELWLLATSAVNSWDSRYYGPVSVADVLTTARPVLVVSHNGGTE